MMQWTTSILNGRGAVLVAAGLVALVVGGGSQVWAGSAAAVSGKAAMEEPNGVYTATVDSDGVAAGRGVWSFTGDYDVDLGAGTLTMDLIHSGQGKITGTGSYEYGDYDVSLTINGSVKGSAGAVVMTLTMAGTEEITADKEALRVRIRMVATLDEDQTGLTAVAIVQRTIRRLSGSSTDDSTKGLGTKGVFATSCVLDLPSTTIGTITYAMDGTYSIDLHLTTFGTAVSGEALMVLSNGDEYPILVKGKRAGDLSVLTLTGEPTVPTAKGIKAKVNVTTLDDGTADIETFTGKLFGQKLTW